MITSTSIFHFVATVSANSIPDSQALWLDKFPLPVYRKSTGIDVYMNCHFFCTRRLEDGNFGNLNQPLVLMFQENVTKESHRKDFFCVKVISIESVLSQR